MPCVNVLVVCAVCEYECSVLARVGLLILFQGYFHLDRASILGCILLC